MGFRARSFALAAVAVAYVAIAALQATAGSAVAALMLVGLPIALAVAWSRTSALRAVEAAAQDGDQDIARSAARAAFAGAAIALAASSGTDAPAFVAAGNFGAALASIGALVALSRARGAPSLVEPNPAARRLDAAAIGALAWAVAIALPAASLVAPERALGLAPFVTRLATTAAALTGLGLLVASSLVVLVRRRLEFGLADRAEASLWLTTTLILVTVGAAATDVARADRLAPFACAVAGAIVAASSIAARADALARGLRVVLATSALVAPVALLTAYVARSAPKESAALIVAACGTTAIAGMIAPLVGHRFFAPAAGRWLSALEAATRAAMTPDPDSALRAALLALRGAAGQGGRDPALYHLGTKEVVTVDRAGYAQHQSAELPARLVELADAEPERVLRLEALRAAEVRRPDVRPLAAWLDERGFSAVAVVRDESEPVSLLALPRGGRTRAWTLEEAKALRALADRLGAVLGASAQLARSRAREVELRRELGAVRSEATALARSASRDEGRRRAAARLIARPAEVAAYSPAARVAIDQIERVAALGRPIALLSAPGIDAAAWAAVAHLASPRSDGPLVIVDGANGVEHDLEFWRDPDRSPIAAAALGTLVLVDAHALPVAVQSYVAAALPEETGLVVSLRGTVDALVASGGFGEHLADRLGDRAVALPTLASRAEDVRALALETLARVGVRLHNRPLGLAPSALAALLEHDFPGNDAELVALLFRAALFAGADVITEADLARIGFGVRAAPARTSVIPEPRRTKRR